MRRLFPFHLTFADPYRIQIKEAFLFRNAALALFDICAELGFRQDGAARLTTRWVITQEHLGRWDMTDDIFACVVLP